MPIDEILQQRFEAAVELLAEPMFRVAYRLTGDRDSAGELVQESYLQAWKNLNSLSDTQKMGSWLFAILRNQYTKHLRKVSKHQRLTPAMTESIAANDLPKTEGVEELVQAAFNKLNDQYKLPLLLVAMEGLSTNEAADILGIPRGTVLSRLHRGREKLKQILNQESEFPQILSVTKPDRQSTSHS